MRPNYVLKVGPETFNPDTVDGVVSIEVNLSMGLPIDSVEALLVGGRDFSFKKDDPVAVQLGYDENFVPAFIGFVDNVEHGISRVRLTALGHSLLLLRLRLNRVYLNQTAGGIVRNLAQEAGVKVKEAADGISFPMYVIDDGLNGYEHVLRLAERCNFDVYVTDDGQLVFKEFGGGRTHTLEYGRDILQVEGADFVPAYAGATVYGESPSSVRGAETFHWLTKQEVKGEAGSGPPLVIQDPVIRSRETAERVASAELNRLQYTFAAVIETVGRPEIKLGDAVAIKSLNDPAINGEFQVRVVRHYLSKTKGFTSRISCWRKG